MKISASYSKDRQNFPVDDSAWEESMAAAQRPSTSRPRRPRSGQRSPSKKRRREESENPSGPLAPPPPQQAHPSSSTVQPPVQGGSQKGKAGANSRVKGSSRRPDLPAAPPATLPVPPPRDHSAQRQPRGGQSSRGQGRGRGGRQQSNRNQGAVFSVEDRNMFEEMKRHFRNAK